MLINSRLTLVTWQSLYMGIMMLICFVSLIMFLLFRDRLFIYYVLMMFFLGLYFPRMYGVLDPLAFPLLGNPYISLAHIIISGIVIFTFLFISRYTSLKQVMPRYFWLYPYGFAGSFPVCTHRKAVRLSNGNINATHNFIMLAWVVICFFPIFRSSLKPDPAARVLLVSIVFMFLGSVVLILNLLKILPSIPMVQHSFQFGVLAFSGILFYGLFDRIRSIQDERQRIKELDGLKSRFFANISHEFRTPLTLIMGPVEQVMERTDDPEDKRLLGMAKGNASRLLQLVNQLLDLSRINTGKMTLHVREMNLTRCFAISCSSSVHLPKAKASA
jgi:signal transduction histidine kinase